VFDGSLDWTPKFLGLPESFKFDVWYPTMMERLARVSAPARRPPTVPGVIQPLA